MTWEDIEAGAWGGPYDPRLEPEAQDAHMDEALNWARVCGPAARLSPLSGEEEVF